MLEGVAKGTVVGAVDVVRGFETLLGNADGEDEVGVGDDGVGDFVVFKCPMVYCAVCEVVEDVGPIVGGPSTGVEGELAFGFLRGEAGGKQNCHGYN